MDRVTMMMYIFIALYIAAMVYAAEYAMYALIYPNTQKKEPIPVGNNQPLEKKPSEAGFFESIRSSDKLSEHEKNIAIMTRIAETCPIPSKVVVRGTHVEIVRLDSPYSDDGYVPEEKNVFSAGNITEDSCDKDEPEEYDDYKVAADVTYVDCAEYEAECCEDNEHEDEEDFGGYEDEYDDEPNRYRGLQKQQYEDFLRECGEGERQTEDILMDTYMVGLI